MISGAAAMARVLSGVGAGLRTAILAVPPSVTHRAIMPFIPLEKRERLENGYCRRFAAGKHRVLLIHSDGETVVIDERCPHDGASLAKGRIAAGCIRCPKHGIHFSLASGAAQGGEAVAAVPPLRRLPVVEQGGWVGTVVD